MAKCKDDGRVFSIAVIPHTWDNTSLKYLAVGNSVNLEADLLDKYTESLLKAREFRNPGEKPKSSMSLNLDWLADNGWN